MQLGSKGRVVVFKLALFLSGVLHRGGPAVRFNCVASLFLFLLCSECLYLL